MSVDTKLLINIKYDAEDIIDILRAGIAKPESVKLSESRVGARSLWVDFDMPGKRGGSRHMHVYRGIETPLGTATILSLGADDEAVKIMRAIADRIGGFFQPEDCTGDYEEIRGNLYEGDGLAYHLKDAVKAGKVNEGSLCQIDNLRVSIESWNERIHGKKEGR